MIIQGKILMVKEIIRDGEINIKDIKGMSLLLDKVLLILNTKMIIKVIRDHTIKKEKLASKSIWRGIIITIAETKDPTIEIEKMNMITRTMIKDKEIKIIKERVIEIKKTM